MATGRRVGRPAMPVEKQRALGNPGKRALPEAPGPQGDNAQPAIISNGLVPEAPKGLKVFGQKAWTDIWTAGRIWLHPEVDREQVTLVVQALETRNELRRYLKKRGVEGRWFVNERGQVVTHPAVKQLADIEAQLTTWFSLIGFNPSDRTRLGLAQVRVADELDELRKRRTERRDESGPEMGTEVLDAEIVEAI